MSRRYKILLAILILAVVAGIIAAFFLFRSQPDPQTIKDAAARAKEIDRVSLLVVKVTKDNDLMRLASNADSLMTTQYTGLVNYLQETGVNVSQSELSAQQDSMVDSQLAAASKTDKLQSEYDEYLRTNVLAYRAALKIATGDMDQKGKDLVNSYLAGTQNLLNSNQLQSGQ